MIRIKNLCKTYANKNRFEVKALNNINLNLPNSGFVFIVGKSGSGKSTLLNMLSGLDRPTSGEIYIGEKNIFDFTNAEIDDYRATCLGFVFQDFHLLENLTVYENIKLSLSLKQQDDEKLISSTLKQVGLDGYGERKIVELSGGECQRVAIARSLVKNPQVILADEPTGNLDSKTSVQVLKILKKISKTNLVVIVSHNLDDAYTYGDRIIELKDGAVISDKAKNDKYKNEFKIEDGVLTLPYKKQVSKKELELLKTEIDNGKIKKIKQLDDGFEKIKANSVGEVKSVEFKKSKLLRTETFSLAKNFFKGQKILSIVTIVLVTLLMTLFGLIQSFVMFDAKNVFNSIFDEFSGSSVALYKGVYDEYDEKLESKYMVPLSLNEEQKLIDGGYEGKIYRLYNYTFSPSGSVWKRCFYTKLSDKTNLLAFYLQETYGTLVCDKDYLIKTFGVNGELQVLAGDINNTNGVIITDYMADSFLHFKKYDCETYNDLIGVINSNIARGRISAIIGTGYKQKYGKFRDDYFASFSINTKTHYKELLKTDICKQFYSDVIQNLGIAYSFTDSFKQQALIGERDAAYVANAEFIFNGNSFSKGQSVSFIDEKVWGKTLADDEIMIAWSTYNNLFGTVYNSTNYKTDFVPHNVTIVSHNSYSDLDDQIKFSRDFKIVGLTPNYTLANKNNLDYFAQFEYEPYALYLDNPQSLGTVYENIEKENFYLNLEEYNVILSIRDIVETFKEFFFLIVAFVFVLSALVVSFFANFIIKKNRKNIGIMRALGMSSFDVLKIFASQILFISLIIIGLTVGGYFGFIALGNMLLKETFINLFNSKVVASLTLLKPSVLMIFVDLFIMLIALAITILIEMAALKKVNVIRIIKMEE